ncbi:phage tail protein [Cellulomonas sp. ATA003]|uniref:phage tail protein n=1 Tax=Cellulomonas sp. ATA003 TaxID=3073064 RepID=UPI002872D7CA|nr:phage tail protein [Cellulomonas sp. ATA003]WNB87305.1 phage tail protein [Cellulomonas sp. ATA003]
MDADRIALLLPEVYRRALVAGSPLDGILHVMAAQHAPVEGVLHRFPEVFDPYLTPDRFVTYLARWVDLLGWLEDEDGELATGNGRLRVLVAASAELARRRGTAAGLRTALTLALGVPGVEVDDLVPGPDDEPVPFLVRVTVPAEAAEHAELVERIVREEKPAHVVAEVVYLGGPPDGDG